MCVPDLLKSDPALVSACSFTPGWFFISLGRGLWGMRALWALSRRARNRATHATHGNGKGGDRWARKRQKASSSETPGLTFSERRHVTRHPATRSELETAGYTFSSSSSSLAVDASLHLQRRRLCLAARETVVAATKVSHIIVDDLLGESNRRWGPSYQDQWKIHTSFNWADSEHPRPLVVFPSHLTRLRERVEWEFSNNSAVEAGVVLVVVPPGGP